MYELERMWLNVAKESKNSLSLCINTDGLV